MLYEFLKEAMLKNPSKTLRDEENVITFKELIEYAESFAKKLTYHKYGILCRSELDTAKALMSCLCAKKTAVILSHRYGDKHSKRIIDKINLSYIITENEVENVADEKYETEDLSDVALIMCTSGTTGTPKGAMITNENLVTNLGDIEKYFSINEADRILIARPLYHCAVLTGEFFISLIKGLDIVFIGGDFNPIKVVEKIRQEQISVMCGTPTLFYHICNIAKRQAERMSLRTIAVSGECMTQIVADKMQQSMLDVRIYNVYGLTEASPRVSFLSPDLFNKYPTSVGIPLSSITAKTVDDELVIKGKSIMKGYYNDSESTHRAIVDGWLYTGDVAQIDENGFIYIKSRKDNMIIRAGMNIYPQEIENAIKQDFRIKEALAMGVKSDKVSQKIHLTVSGEDLTKSYVLDVCKKYLSTYQFPDEIEIVSDIPKNASGKILRSKEQVFS